MTKIHILGGPGSGKSTLARALASRLSIPQYDLDILGQKNGTDPEAHIDDAFTIAEQPGWIAEGIYVVVTDPYLYAADVIVLLDIPWRIAAWRIIRRHIIASVRGVNQYPGLRALLNLLSYTRGYYLNQPSDKAELMARCLREHRAMELPPTREEMIRFLDTYHEVSIPPTMEFVRLYLQKYQSKIVRIRKRTDLDRLYRRFEGV